MPTKLDLEEEPREMRYDFVGLNRNPFHPDPDPPDPPKVFAEYRKIWSKINTKISLVRKRGYNQNLMLFGDYGRGKSHAIKFLRSQINSGATHGIAFIANVPQSLRFSDLYNTLITSINKNLLMEKIKPGKAEGLPGRLGKDMESALKCLFKPEKSELAWRWLQGSVTYSGERQRIPVMNKLDRGDEICLSALVALFEALVKSGVKLIFVGIDEVETAKTRYASETRSTERLLESFRRLIDEVQSNIFFLLAATEEWYKVWSRFGPLVTRFPSYDIHHLDEISKIEEYKLFILDYLDSERVDEDEIWNKIREKHQEKTSSMSREQLQESGLSDDEIYELVEKRKSMRDYLLFPFTDEGVYALFEMTKGLPRNIVRSCHYLIEKAIEQASDIDSVKTIDRDFVLKHEPEILPLVT